MRPFRRSVLLWCGLVLLATWAVYFPALRAGFIWDDPLLVTANPLLRTPGGLYRIWFGADSPDFFPLTSTSFWIEWHLWGNAATGYHIVNVILHSTGALLLGFVLSRLRVPGAWIAALIFAIHPVNAASVAWVAERKNNLSMVFYLASILMYLKFEAAGKPRWYGGALVMFFCALLAKTSVVMLPLVLLGCAWWLRGAISRRDLARAVPFFVLAALFGLLTVLFQHRAVTDFPKEDLAFLIARAGWAVWFYAGKALFPVGLCMIYPEPHIDTGSIVAWLPAIGVVAAGTLFWVYRKSWGRPFFFGFGYFAVTLAPVLGFVYMTFLAQACVADWWQYTSLPGIVALVTGLAATGCRHIPAFAQKLAGIALVLLLGWLGADTWRQASLYDSMEICCRAIIAGNPMAGTAHNNLGIALAAHSKTSEAITEYTEALRINPLDTLAHNNLALTFFQLGRFDDAIPHYMAIVRIQPGYAQGHANLASALANRGDISDAILQFRAALLLRPERLDFQYDLANALAIAGRLDEAVVQYRLVLRNAPTHVQSLANLARILATSGDPAVRNGDEALRDALLVNKLTGEKNLAILNTLAAAFAETGQFEKAEQTARQAIALARGAGRNDLAESIEKRLAEYEAHRPWHEH